MRFYLGDRFGRYTSAVDDSVAEFYQPNPRSSMQERQSYASVHRLQSMHSKFDEDETSSDSASSTSNPLTAPSRWIEYELLSLAKLLRVWLHADRFHTVQRSASVQARYYPQLTGADNMNCTYWFVSRPQCS